MDKPAITSVPINECLAGRWSGRAYDPDKPVNREHLIACLEAARWAPSNYGDEPWRYMVWVKAENEELWRKAFDCLSHSNQEWVNNSPVLMASFAHKYFTHNQRPNRWGEHDVGAASVSMAIQAASMGLMVHQMGGFDADKLKEAFSVPDEFTPMAMITLGWPGDPDVLNEKNKDREFAPRVREPIQDHFFEGVWGKGI